MLISAAVPVMVTVAVSLSRRRAGAGGHVKPAVQDRQRGRERSGVHIGDRHAGDRQRRVLVDALCARHRVHRRVGQRGDRKDRRPHVAECVAVKEDPCKRACRINPGIGRVVAACPPEDPPLQPRRVAVTGAYFLTSLFGRFPGAYSDAPAHSSRPSPASSGLAQSPSHRPAPLHAGPEPIPTVRELVRASLFQSAPLRWPAFRVARYRRQSISSSLSLVGFRYGQNKQQQGRFSHSLSPGCSRPSPPPIATRTAVRRAPRAREGSRSRRRAAVDRWQPAIDRIGADKCRALKSAQGISDGGSRGPPIFAGQSSDSWKAHEVPGPPTRRGVRQARADARAIDFTQRSRSAWDAKSLRAIARYLNEQESAGRFAGDVRIDRLPKFFLYAPGWRWSLFRHQG